MQVDLDTAAELACPVPVGPKGRVGRLAAAVSAPLRPDVKLNALELSNSACSHTSLSGPRAAGLPIQPPSKAGSVQQGHDVLGVALSGDGATAAASCATGLVAVYDVAAGRCVNELKVGVE